MRNAVTIVIITGLLALGLINNSILQKEALLEEGDVVYLELAPVDPRSLMQGDYMALRFAASNKIRAELRKRQAAQGITGWRLETHDGTIAVKLDDRLIGRFARITDQHKLAADEQLIRFRVRNGQVEFATNAFFFQEGTAEQYTEAKYGEFRVAADGNLLLTNLRDKDLKLLGSAQEG